ncbi:MAG: hypothetical protein JZU60_02035 [Ilumatobacteraceae bacterium]|jgi:hypothetical protein|nr:hypothetical protein [Ilumatobacteraceae bacterium]
MTSLHIHQSDTQWVVIARKHEGITRIFTNTEDGKYQAFPSEAAALQFMKAEGWPDDLIAKTFFLSVEDDE